MAINFPDGTNYSSKNRSTVFIYKCQEILYFTVGTGYHNRSVLPINAIETYGTFK